MKKIIICFSLLTLLLLSCASTLAIGDFGDGRGLFEGQNLTIEGVVTDTINSTFGDDGMYRVFDEDYQSIWVRSEKLPLPERGSIVRVSGELRKRDDIKKRLFGLILEEEKRKILKKAED